MKKLFLTAMAALTLGVASFAKDVNKVNSLTLHNFQKSFSEATDVDWSVTPVYTKAKFKLDGEVVEAFYDGLGALIGTSRKVELKSLPLNATQQIKKKYGKYPILDTIEFIQNDETRYYVSLDKNGKKLVLEVSGQGSVSEFHANMQ